ncbi:hypothetical protein QVD17_41034 [Tagetes erecta]|uniref:3-hydroxyisobutyryl-CoA hydrolase n=1 Tax=Tagetes erecta TaxID=13708 RepID=A0AAD8JSH9_TARER|nr:hypothetical protein QVD17_41034 [Tagetes erecta]
MAQTNQVLVTQRSNVRTIILNRPEQLNVFNLKMTCQLLELLQAYEEDPTVKLIIFKGEGRAFCAGGDIKAVVDDINKGSWKQGASLFSTGYKVHYLKATYTKTQVIILRGIAIGSGAALAIHGTFQVVTDNTVFALPEAALGSFPDAGSSYYLSRLPGFFGEYVGLTCVRLDGAEMLACGLASHYVPLEKLSSLEDALCEANTGDPKIINNIINNFSNKNPKLKEKSPYYRLKTINRCFSKRTVEEIISALKDADKNMDDWISMTIQTLKKALPTSLKISLRSIREGRLQGIGQCLIREYRIICTVLQGVFCRDFFEGYRALLVDKDKNPKWEPSKLEFVSKRMVDYYFVPLADKGWEDLKLPARSNLTSHAISKL